MNRPREWPLVRDRTAFACDLARGLHVLDIGCTGCRGDGVTPEIATTLHHSLRAVCRHLTGVDVDAEGVGRMQAAGFDVVCADVTTMRLGRTFEMIVAGEVIEHLCNPGLALRNLAAHLCPSGRLLLTTPNPLQLHEQWRVLRRDDIRIHPRHTAWHDPYTLSYLLECSGFEVVSGVWIHRASRRHPLEYLSRWRRYWNQSFAVVARQSAVPGDPTQSATAGGLPDGSQLWRRRSPSTSR